ncbi:MAG TPA: nitroreductase family protein [Bacteroidales bacterium]|nr:nitroreductase family protein [Bacteroidales bacterium]
MDFEDIILRNRSYRRFYEDFEITKEVLRKLIGYARLSASSGNIQGLKFYLSADRVKNEIIFRHLQWAFYLKDWNGPEKGERPSAYIIILGDTDIHATVDIDVGIAAQSILLGATTMGLGGCMFGSVNRVGLRKDLHIPRKFQIPLTIALGKPKEKIVIEEVDSTGNIVYWRDKEKTHHVPKRSLDELIVEFRQSKSSINKPI